MKQFGQNHLLCYFSQEELVKIYELDDLYTKAKIIISELFKDKFDKGGEPYIGHLLRVAGKLDDEIEKVAGLLHDTLEDTEVTYEDLLELGFTTEILDIVVLVTNKDIDTTNMSKDDVLNLYDQKIDYIINSGNLHAVKVKAADMSDNYDPNRLRKLSKEQQEWFRRKYGTQIIKLKDAIALAEEG